MDTATANEPNHHAHHPGFSGIGGFIAGLTMVAGRGRVARWAADVAAVDGERKVVDVGCGPGAAAREAARRGASVIGVDPAAVMLTLARRLTRRALAVSWINGTAESLPLPDASADVIWSIATVHHWRDVDRGLEEVRRVLAHGGMFVAIERRTRPHARGLASHGWTDDQAKVLADMCRAKGFEQVAVTTKRLRRSIHLAVTGAR